MSSENLFCSASRYPLHVKKHLVPIKSEIKPLSRTRSSKPEGRRTKHHSVRRVRSCSVPKLSNNFDKPIERNSCIEKLLDPRETVCDASGKGITHNEERQVTAQGENKCKKKKISALSAVKPENQDAEKEKFIKSKFTYNPQFIYKNQPSEKTLQKHGQPPERLLPIAAKIIETTLKRYRSYDEYEKKTGGKKLSNSEIIAIVKTFLADEGLKDISVHISDDLVARACMTRVRGQTTLQIQSGNVREKWIDGMLRHEIGTHYIRGYNNRQHEWKVAKRRRELKMEPVNPTEEGLASLNTVLLRDEPYLIRAAMLYYTVTKAADLSFCELFDQLGKYIKDPETRWDYCLRAKRGLSDTSKPGGFQKDQVYLKGLLRILKNRNTIDFDMLFRLGKVCYKDIERLKNLADLENTRVPGFAQDIGKYIACLNNVMQKNGLTDLDLETV